MFKQLHPYRYHLLRLAAPIDELFVRFGVRELLEEAGNILNSHQNPRMPSMDYKVRELRPRLYRHVVPDLKPTGSYFHVGADFRAASEKEIGKSWSPMPVFKLDELIDPANFERLLPTLNSTLEAYDNYGLELYASTTPYIQVNDRRIVWSGYERRRTGWSPGAGDIYENTGIHKVVWSAPEPDYPVAVRVTKSFSVTGGVTEGGKVGLLNYRHKLDRVDLRNRDDIEARKSAHLNAGTTLTTPTMINASDPIEILRNLVGNDVAKELNGEYAELLHLFKTGGNYKIWGYKNPT